ncbi:hypothetical protein [Chitinophaga sp. YR627]|uniref:hypothetical protein n=1 Tax=Chitinophaga sp. YR627 TaxID=1881041 RepID=UPI00116082EA|nr:hypothetical protein [Chitinophaga sp. YR627]
MKGPRYKKIYYVPGVISLLVLPVLFVVYASVAQRPGSYHVLPVIIRNKQLEEKFPEIYKWVAPINERSYEDINITGYQDADQVKLAYAQIRIREILRQNNFAQGIHYHFGDSSNYGAFVKALDILATEEAQLYMVEDNNIWFYHVPPDTTEYPECGTSLPQYLTCKVFYAEKPLPTVPLLTRIKDAWDSSWLLIIGFSLFLGVALARLRYRLNLK